MKGSCFETSVAILAQVGFASCLFASLPRSALWFARATQRCVAGHGGHLGFPDVPEKLRFAEHNGSRNTSNQRLLRRGDDDELRFGACCSAVACKLDRPRGSFAAGRADHAIGEPSPRSRRPQASVQAATCCSLVAAEQPGRVHAGRSVEASRKAWSSCSRAKLLRA